MVQAVFFDFDGVIADSEPLHLRAYQQILQQEGITLDRGEYYERYLGFDDAGLFAALARDRGMRVAPQLIERWVEHTSKIVEAMLSDGSMLFPGAADCVRMCAARAPLAVASGALEPEIRLVLDAAGLTDCFEAIASASDGVPGKPAADLYRLAIARLSARRTLDPQRCVAIEDSHWGLDAARAAGLRCVAITHTYPASELQTADLVIEHLSDLTASRLDALVRDNGREQ